MDLNVKKEILIVEDNADLASLVQLHLEDVNCHADIAQDGATALNMYQKKKYDLVLLDIMLPVMDGISVCHKMREFEQEGAYVPIMMLTSKASEIDRVVGLEVGADDYITKPFSIPELLARIKAQFRTIEALKQKTTPPASEQEEIHMGSLMINLNKRQVCMHGKEISLTAKEFDLLAYFSKHPGQVFTRTQLLDQVWGYQFEGYDHTVNTHINRLRLKIEQDPAKPKFILTVWGVGYKCGEGI